MKAVLDSEGELNALDAAMADGDLGRNMARAAQLVLAALKDGALPMAWPALLFLRLADVLRGVDGTLSALLSVFFGRAGRHLAQRRLKWQKTRHPRGTRRRCSHLGWDALEVYDALCAGEKEVETVGESAEGQRTFLDALLPALRVAGKSIKPAEAEGLFIPLEDDEEYNLEFAEQHMDWGRQTSADEVAPEIEESDRPAQEANGHV
ncbi:unnamed protein product [Effrenium voratum]|uniref:DhaL domain-containing protein n=1 Tax=Effrenium voratum TaxID=2562239 RepID=A0AA36IYH1_9DINO|nr:unnamed protein product [Effrenium voratum]